MGKVDDFIEAVPDERKRADSRRLIEIMSRVTGEPPELNGTIVGFGRYHYRYASGHEGDSCLTGFSPRKAEFSIYLSCVPDQRRDRLLERLGKHRLDEPVAPDDRQGAGGDAGATSPSRPATPGSHPVPTRSCRRRPTRRRRRRRGSRP